VAVICARASPLPRRSHAPSRASGQLVQILPALATDGLALHLVWSRSRQLLPKVDGLIRYLGSGLGIRRERAVRWLLRPWPGSLRNVTVLSPDAAVKSLF